MIYVAGHSPALQFCTSALQESGFTVLPEPDMEVTHLLLPVPSFTPEGCIVGGGNTAFEDALFLAQFCTQVHLIHRRDAFRADQVTVDKVKANPKINLVLNSVPVEILGEDCVTGVKVKNVKTEELSQIDCSGLFVAIGAVPQTDFLKNSLVALADNGLVLADERTHTTIEGIFAAGDCADKHYRQAIIAAGTGAKAGIEAAAFVNLHR